MYDSFYTGASGFIFVICSFLYYKDTYIYLYIFILRTIPRQIHKVFTFSLKRKTSR